MPFCPGQQIAIACTVRGAWVALSYRYLSSTNLPVFVDASYRTMKVRSWLFMLTLIGSCCRRAGAAFGLGIT